MPFTFKSQTPFGIGFEELEGSPKIKINPRTGIQATRLFHINWADWGAFARELLGVVALIGGQQVFASPFGFPGMPYLVIEDIGIKPMMGDSPDGNTNISLGQRTNDYAGGAKISIIYKSIDLNTDANRPNIPDGTYLSIDEDIGADYMTVRKRSWVWDGGADDGKVLPEDTGSGILLPTGQYAMSWSRVTSVPRFAITSKRGQVNNATWCGFAAQTLLFTGAKIRRQFQIMEDSGLYQVDYGFSESVFGWNKQWNPHTQTWTQVKGNGSGFLPYSTTTFDELFQFG